MSKDNYHGRGTIDHEYAGPGTHDGFTWVVRDPQGVELGRVTPVAGHDGDWYAKALALLGLKRPHMASPPVAMLLDGWDAWDTWGSAMNALGSLDDARHILDTDPCLVTVDECIAQADDWTAEIVPHVASDTVWAVVQVAKGAWARESLDTACRILDRYIDWLQREHPEQTY